MSCFPLFFSGTTQEPQGEHGDEDTDSAGNDQYTSTYSLA